MGGTDNIADSQNGDRVGRAVVVTTEHRGVFFGYIKEDQSPMWIELDRCRMAIMWDSSIRGVLGLASHGPSNSCRISHDTPHGKIWKITGVFACSEVARDKWESAPWK